MTSTNQAVTLRTAARASTGRISATDVSLRPPLAATGEETGQ
jgi:hypothetical protein